VDRTEKRVGKQNKAKKGENIERDKEQWNMVKREEKKEHMKRKLGTLQGEKRDKWTRNRT
jgi:hypothetical protein